MTRIHSGQSKGVGTSMELKLYRNGTLFGSILSMLVLESPKTERRHLLTWPEMPLQKIWSKSTYDCGSISTVQLIDVKRMDLLRDSCNSLPSVVNERRQSS